MQEMLIFRFPHAYLYASNGIGLWVLKLISQKQKIWYHTLPVLHHPYAKISCVHTFYSSHIKYELLLGYIFLPL
jgi:hypothetical protein